MLLLKRGEQRAAWMWGEHSGRLIFEFSARPSGSEVRDLVSAIEAMFTHLHNMSSLEHFHAYQFPARLLRNGVLREQELEALERSVPHAYEALGEPRRIADLFEKRIFTNLLGSAVFVTDSIIGSLMFLLPTVVGSAPLFDACCFFQECCREYAFVGDTIRETLLDPDETPAHQRDRLAVEGVVLAAFRCIEALVGEPGKGSEKKFRARLLKWGVDYDDPVGFSEEPTQPIGDRLLWLHKLRDSTSAHGRRRRTSPVTYAEAMEAQHLADAVLGEAVWHAANQRGRPEGDDDECAFLLNTMYHDVEYPHWPLHPIRELNNERPVDVIRRPGGLDKIAIYRRG